jgi:hypothetical protein
VNDNDHNDLERDALELPRSIEAPRDLWAGIEARIEAKRRRTVVARRGIAGVSMLMAAAAVVLAVRFAKHEPVAHQTVPAIASEAPHLAPPPTKTDSELPSGVLVPEETSYRTALSALEPTFAEREKALPPKDVAAVSASLRAIDTAITATRGSLAEHPDDADLRGELDAEYEQKIDAMNDVLEWTTRS